MKRKRFEKLLDAFLLGELEGKDRAEFDAALRENSAWAKEVEAHRKLEGMLRNIPQPEVPSQLKSKIMGRVHVERQMARVKAENPWQIRKPGLAQRACAYLYTKWRIPGLACFCVDRDDPYPGSHGPTIWQRLTAFLHEQWQIPALACLAVAVVSGVALYHNFDPSRPMVMADNEEAEPAVYMTAQNQRAMSIPERLSETASSASRETMTAGAAGTSTELSELYKPQDSKSRYNVQMLTEPEMVTPKEKIELDKGADGVFADGSEIPEEMVALAEDKSESPLPRATHTPKVREEAAESSPRPLVDLEGGVNLENIEDTLETGEAYNRKAGSLVVSSIDKDRETRDRVNMLFRERQANAGAQPHAGPAPAAEGAGSGGAPQDQALTLGWQGAKADSSTPSIAKLKQDLEKRGVVFLETDGQSLRSAESITKKDAEEKTKIEESVILQGQIQGKDLEWLLAQLRQLGYEQPERSKRETSPSRARQKAEALSTGALTFRLEIHPGD
ncbi:MAG: hypothetical protein ACLFUS_04300 [Candidatus Sumerlaeia bacterium]